MVASSFPKSIAFVLKEEGGNVDNPADPGGRTSRGITQKTYDAYRRNHLLNPQDVYLASGSEVETIYHNMYWDPYCDRLPAGIDLLFFDFAINAGPHRALITLQRAVGIGADGVYGPQTQEAIGKADAEETIDNFTTDRVQFYESLHEGLFLHGWINRAQAAKVAALALIGG